uniref:Uncharacterized protein n=1 Tax=Cacopsylla melanoneura TaxID=428564 RepID=A0A8D9BFS2_9HEMI
MPQWRGEVQLNRQVKKRREMSKLGQGQEVLEPKKHRQGLSTYWEARRAVIDCMVLDQDIFGQGCSVDFGPPQQGSVLTHRGGVVLVLGQDYLLLVVLPNTSQ